MLLGMQYTSPVNLDIYFFRELRNINLFLNKFSLNLLWMNLTEKTSCKWFQILILWKTLSILKVDCIFRAADTLEIPMSDKSWTFLFNSLSTINNCNYCSLSFLIITYSATSDFWWKIWQSCLHNPYISFQWHY